MCKANRIFKITPIVILSLGLFACSNPIESSQIDNTYINLQESIITTQELTQTTNVSSTVTTTTSTTPLQTITVEELVTTTTKIFTTTSETSTTTSSTQTDQPTTVTSISTTTSSVTTQNSIPTTAKTWWTPPATTITTTQTTPITTPPVQSGENIKPLPDYLQGVVDWYKKDYPGMHIGVGIYSLDGKSGYVYNENEEISGGCTVKAGYTLFVLNEMPKTGYNIWTKYLTYQSWMRNDGSGTIKNDSPGTQYTVNTLLTKLDSISDNTAYNILVSEFPLSNFQTFLTSIGGQNLYGCQYGKASVTQRKNEWVAILDYINTDQLYATQLKNYLHNTDYCYLVQGMSNWHDYLHKSGWSNGTGYTSAADVAIIDNQYMIVIMTADYSTGVAHTDVVKSWGGYVEKYVTSIGGAQNLFK